MAGNIYGYVRVSTKEQHEDRQLIAMAEIGVPERNVFCDKRSGKDFVRPVYRRLMQQLGRGDTLVVTSIDRLGRNYAEILEEWRVITKEKGAAVVVLDFPLLDTRQSRDLTGLFIAGLVLQILSYVAETERRMNRRRQTEGIAAARRRGQKFGRKPKERPEIFETLRAAWKEKRIPAREAARRLAIDHHTFKRWAKTR